MQKRQRLTKNSFADSAGDKPAKPESLHRVTVEVFDAHLLRPSTRPDAGDALKSFSMNNLAGAVSDGASQNID